MAQIGSGIDNRECNKNACDLKLAIEHCPSDPQGDGRPRFNQRITIGEGRKGDAIETQQCD